MVNSKAYLNCYYFHQSQTSNNIFIITISEKISLDKAVFNIFNRKNVSIKIDIHTIPLEVNLNLIKGEIKELLLKNRKLFNDSRKNFVD